MKQLDFKIIFLTCCLLAFTADIFAVTNPRPNDLKLTDAYQVLVLHRAEVKAELQVLNTTLTGRHPDVLRKQDQLDSVTQEMDRLERSGIPFEKLNPSYGSLLLKKCWSPRNSRLSGEVSNPLIHSLSQKRLNGSRLILRLSE